MPPRFHDAHVFVAFDRSVQLIERWLQGEAQAVAGYTPPEITARLAQRVVELGLSPFSRQCRRRAENGEEPVVTAPVVLNLDGLFVDLTTGQVRPNLKLFLKSLTTFLMHWLYVVSKTFSSWRQPRVPYRAPATLAFGIGTDSLFVDGSDARFVRFCRQGPITPLVMAHKMIVEAAKQCDSSDPAHFHYSPRPLIALAGMIPIGIGSRVRFMLEHVGMLARFLRAVLHNPVMVILARDFAYTPLVRLLDRLAAIESIVITNSNYNSQPLWMTGRFSRRFIVHMVWYSQNIIPFVYVQDQVGADLPNYRHVRVDVSWVWTVQFASYLNRLGVSGKIHAVGPILWYLPESQGQALDGTEIRIAVLDVTPVTEEAAKPGVILYYYNAETMAEFINGIVSVGNAIRDKLGRAVRILLKHKRADHPWHDFRYLDLVEKLARDGHIELTPTQANMFSFLSNVHIVIVVPYSSPAYVASHIGKAAIYYDPTSNLVPTHLPAPKVSFASGRVELLTEVLRVLQSTPEILGKDASSMHVEINGAARDLA